MLAPMKLRTAPVVSGAPGYEQPTTQSYSGGNQPGRPVSHQESTRPPTPSTRGSR